MNDFYSHSERLMALYARMGMRVMNHYHSITFTVYSQNETVEQVVYGFESNDLKNAGRKFEAIFTDERMFSASGFSHAIVDTVNIRTVDSSVKTGDLISIDRGDNKAYAFTVVNRIKMGKTTDIFYELELSGEGI